MIRMIALGAAFLVAVTLGDARAEDGGLVGGLLGAGAGAVIGGAMTGKAGGAAAGALIGGATGAIIGDQADRRDRHVRRHANYQGGYFWSHGKCLYEFPDGEVTRVERYHCR